MKRLLVINSSASTGSTGTIASGVAKAAHAAGWDVELAHASRFPSPDPLPFKTYTIGSRAGETAHAILSRATDSHGLHSEKATRELIDEIKRFRPDVINLHNVHGYYLNYPLLFDYLRTSGIPVVWTMHDLWAVTGHCAFPAAHGCTRWQQLCGRCPGRKSYPASLFFDRSEANLFRKRKAMSDIPTLTIVAVSHWMARELSRSHLRSVSTEVIQNGIDLDVFAPGKGAENARPVVLAAASRWTARKGFQELMHLADRIREQCDVLAVGLTTKQAKEAAQHGIQARARVQGAEKMAGLYGMADVFVSPSMGDNYPTTLMEALACGTPAAGFVTGGTAEIIGDDCGSLAHPGDADALSRAVMRIVKRGRGHYSQACRAKAEAQFDNREAFRRYLELFNRVAPR